MLRRLILPAVLASATLLPAQQKPVTTLQLPPRPLLPMSFAGWTATATPQEATHPIDSLTGEDRDWMAELGFKREAIGTYRNGSGEIDVMALQFGDATGAYADFSGSDDANHPQLNASMQEAVFRHRDVVVHIEYAKSGNKSWRDALPDLVRALPIATGSNAQLPTLPDYLPKDGLIRESVIYTLGPIGFSRSQSPLSGKLDFNTGAEVVVGQYGSGSLTLIEYPTPQMAIAQLKSIAASLNLQPQKSLPDGYLGDSNLVAWRTGPLVGLTSGLPQPQAVKLASQIHYSAEVTLDKPQGYISEAWRAAHLYLGIAALSGILCSAAVFFGLFFGGARAIIRVVQGKPASAAGEAEFISLDLGHGGNYRPPPPPPPAD